MDYTVQALAKLAGVSGRTLRYYDNIGLLKPSYVNESGYRIYRREQLDRLQQILFFRELDIPLQEIAAALDAPDYDREQTLRQHREELLRRRDRTDALIHTIDRTIQDQRGEKEMSDNEKFEAFKQNLVDENERKYGAEIREKYGEQAVAESNARMMNLSREQYDEMQALSGGILTALESAVESGENPKGVRGKEIAEMHRRWLGYTWPKYSREAHIGLGNMYVDDERFTAYYDGNVPGCARFLRDAIAAHM